MPSARCNGVEICHEVLGSGPPIVLIMGIASQMILWDDAFCAALVARGFQVVRFDHRDVGLSDSTGEDVPDVPSLVARALCGLAVPSPYTLSDMAKDVVGLLDHLGIDRAHVVGVSMGGMIAQNLAIEHPTRVRSLTSIMSTPGGRRHLLGIRASALRAFFGSRPRTREEGAAFAVELYRALNGTGIPFPEERTRARAAQLVERAWRPKAFPRHLAAVLAATDRTPDLQKLRLPTLVMHGTHDPLIPFAAGKATAAAIPGARFVEVPGMGHFLPPQTWEILIDSIATHASGA